MPTINRPVKKKRSNYIHHNSNKRNNVIHHNVYNTNTWAELRKQHLKEYPLCEICEEKGKLTLAILVHHIKHISKGRNITEMKDIGFDWNNLQSLCKDCHTEVHKN